LIKLLDHCKSQKIPYNELINHLIRQLGLYPYLDIDTSSWQENFVYVSSRSEQDIQKPHLRKK
jgi:hypothetical protein